MEPMLLGKRCAGLHGSSTKRYDAFRIDRLDLVLKVRCQCVLERDPRSRSLRVVRRAQRPLHRLNEKVSGIDKPLERRHRVTLKAVGPLGQHGQETLTKLVRIARLPKATAPRRRFTDEENALVARS